ncbi:hemerythrin domain-containing protein [Sphingomonas sp. AP4-R1]|uniref:hemerythrin domain-containing protein n=1 Tax=Sphingomonas sp. AP4-R1 TaxID=2735134 RepID=UPI0014937CA8|nr:hemerythrin domain-containing protein [Sphingomonas sp. AP4-R1]QJU56530.1 hemerythrin domain-containing protein [Sphingomonas sp. AP4-R1]
MAENYAARNNQGLHRIAKDDPLAIAILKEEHHRFRDLFTEANEASGARLKHVADEICLRLDVHMTIEEEILYPAGKQVGERSEVDEGIVEHAAGKELAAEIQQLKGTEELYKSKVHVLGEQTIHHIDEEDEELFEEMKAAHKAGKIDLDAVGLTLRARQAVLYRTVEASGDLGPTQEADAEEIARV